MLNDNTPIWCHCTCYICLVESTSTSSPLSKGIGQTEENKTKQNIIEKLTTNIIPKTRSLHAFLIKTRFLKALLISELYFLAGLKDKRPKEVNNHCRYYHCNNTHIYSNNYLATLEGWQAGWVSMTEKSRQQALFLFTSWLKKFKSLSNKVFLFSVF